MGLRKILHTREEKTKINKIVSKLNKHVSVDNYNRDNNGEIIVPVACEKVSDLYQNISINGVRLLNTDVYNILLQNIEGMAISDDIVIYVDSKDAPTNQEKETYALAHKHGYLMNAIRYTNKKIKLTKNSWRVLFLFIIAFIIIGGLEYVKLKFEDSFFAPSIGWKTVSLIFEEIMFVVLWVLGWTYCDILFFDQRNVNRDIALRYQIYKAKIIFKKDKKMTEIKPFAEVNKMLHTKEAEVASKVFSKEEKHDAKEA
ncbi:MAG: hypothetical protein LBV22_01950, partial [Mycoplasmataceae bacterium]|nr:hypothetical protein [Mycoplasmataceae bacterium]